VIERDTMDNRYRVVTRLDGMKTWHVVVDGAERRGTIDSRRIIVEFKDRPKADAHAAMLNGKPGPSY
jgi:hypothetical protein